MYSIVEIKGHQYRVEAGTLLDVEKIESEVGSSIDLDQVLFVGGEKPQLGKPVVSGAKVKAQVVWQGKGPKVRVYRRGVGKWRRTMGHRQLHTGLLVTEITDGEGNTSTIDKNSETAKKFLK